MPSFQTMSPLTSYDIINALCPCIWLENPIGMAAFSCKVNYSNKLVKSTSKTGVRLRKSYKYIHNLWLRMYPEIAMLNSWFMVSSTTIEREIRFSLLMLWTYFRNCKIASLCLAEQKPNSKENSFNLLCLCKPLRQKLAALQTLL